MGKLTLFPAVAVSLLECMPTPEVPLEWQTPDVMGHGLLSSFISGRHGWIDDLSTAPNEPLFENVWLRSSAPRVMKLNDVIIRMSLAPETSDMIPEGASWAMAPATWKPDRLPYSIEDFLTSWGEDKIIERFERLRPGCPISLRLYEAEPFCLRERYEADCEGFLRWRSRHPAFYSVYGLDEYDHNRLFFRNRRDNESNPEDVRKRFDEDFPRGTPREELAWSGTAMRRTRALYWGCPEVMTLNADLPSVSHEMFRAGSAFHFYEAELGSTSGPWLWGAAFTRGAARQWGRPWGWYSATCLTNPKRRDGTVQEGEWFIRWPSSVCKGHRPYDGCSRSLLKRNEAYGYFAGAKALETEMFFDLISEDAPEGGLRLSPYGRDLNDIFVWNKTHDRGVPYTPVAILYSVAEEFSRQLWMTHANDKFSMAAFMTTLVPTPGVANTALYADRDHGEEGCLWNSPYGELCDVLCPDSGQASATFARILGSYPRAFLVGYFEKQYFDTAALVNYVKAGGDLVVERKHVEAGLVPVQIPGAKGKLTIVEKYLPDYYEASADEWFPTKMAKMASGEVPCPVVKDLIWKAYRELMPIRVKDDIQWGVNRTKTGWLVWLINNKGVKKYVGEPDEIDPNAAADVVVGLKADRRVFRVTVPPGDWRTLEIPIPK